MSAPVLPGFRHLSSGKVRDLYAPDERDDLLLLVASDRVSAFDVVLPTPIPGKGALLTALTRWWMDRLPDVPNDLVAAGSPAPAVPPQVADRATLVRRLRMHPVECVVRGAVTGSGYAEYRERGSISGVALPAGLRDGDRLPEPIFTPAFKAEQGDHDENIPFDRVVELVGGGTAEALRAVSLDVFRRGAAVAAARGLLLVDTKLEYGADPAVDGPVLADEVLTSDSSRYWDAAAYARGSRGVAFDKQVVRDWLREHWDGEGDPPPLPPDVVAATADRYRVLVERLTA